MRMQTLSGRKRSIQTRIKNALPKCLEIALAMLMLMSVAIGGVSVRATEDTSTADITAADDSALSNYKKGSYGEYEANNSDKALYEGDPITIKATEYVDTNMNVENYGTYEGVANSVYLPGSSIEQEENEQQISGEELDIDVRDIELGYVSYKFNIKQSGLYAISLKYYPIEGKGATIERGFMIDGEYLFSECEYVTFSRVWKDDAPVGSVFDAGGNEIHPTISEAPEWRVEYADYDQGYYSDPFLFYFEAGTHELKLVSQKEPMVLSEINLTAKPAFPTYEEVKQEYAQKGYTASSKQLVKIEGESTYKKSESSLYPYYSRSSAATTSVNGAFTYDHTQVNVIGGDFWKYAGDWLSWEITVPESGLYTISIRGRQNVNRGLTSGRILTINGEIPFEEAKYCTFNYSSDFTNYTLSDYKSGENFQFYFEAGKTYEIALKATLGNVQNLAESVDSSVNTLMAVYRRLLMYIGNTPDKERDYKFDEYMPDQLQIMREQAVVLRELAQQLNEIAGERTSQQEMLERTATLLDRMAKRSIVIAANFTTFKNDLSAIANWILDLSYQPLEVDKIYVASPDMELPKAKAGFFASIGHEVKLFWSSFTTDYTVMGTNTDSDDAITVWYSPTAAGQIIGGGREQAQILKQMIEDDFIGRKDIPVNLQLIDMGALLPATLAGRGPDVALQIDGGNASTNPVQLAMRGAVYDLTNFDDFDSVRDRFYPSSMVAFTYLDGVYALPETQTFEILFYRTDIMEELGLEVPQTWADVYDLIPELQNNYMNFGYPADVNNFMTLIYQNGGSLYKGQGETLGYASNLDSEEDIDAFIKYVDLYRSYKIDLKIDFQTRFRNGEIPIAIQDYTMVNALNVSAPEIRGLWDIARLPGTERTDENGNTYIDRSGATKVKGCVILSKSEKKEQAWEFIKWWTSDDAQRRYCTEVEATIGEAGRIPSANKSVLYSQPWSNTMYQILSIQRSWTKGNPEVPGGYYTARHMENAFNRTYTLMTDPRETLLDYIDEINNELTKKRVEMGIPTIGDIENEQTNGTN